MKDYHQIFGELPPPGEGAKIPPFNIEIIKGAKMKSIPPPPPPRRRRRRMFPNRLANLREEVNK